MLDLPEKAWAERERLQSELSKFNGAIPVRPLDPSCVHASRWSTRQPSAFASRAFLDLQEDIQSWGGNLQPIKVRPISSPPPNAALQEATKATAPAQHYEIVYGHRRHWACMTLGLPVLSLIEDLSDAQLVAQMVRENRQREDPSPWETGRLYARALDEGLFSSMRELAASVGSKPSIISRLISFGRHRGR